MKVDEKSGIEYLEELPEGYREATLDDFHVNGKKKIGMEYIIKGLEWKVFFKKQLSERTTGSQLKPHIDDKRVFVKR